MSTDYEPVEDYQDRANLEYPGKCFLFCGRQFPVAQRTTCHQSQAPRSSVGFRKGSVGRDYGERNRLDQAAKLLQPIAETTQKVVNTMKPKVWSPSQSHQPLKTKQYVHGCQCLVQPPPYSCELWASCHGTWGTVPCPIHSCQ